MRPGAPQRLEQIQFFTAAQGASRHLLFEELDDGIAWCEDEILSTELLSTNDTERRLRERLVEITGDEAHASVLEAFFLPMEFTVGEYLFKQGDVGDAMYLVGRGQVALVLGFGDREKVVRRYTAGAILGEMALYTGEPRSASVVVEQRSLVYKLDSNALAELGAKNPTLASEIHAYIVRLLAERLARANRELANHF